jgi:hypothetical protein
VQEATRNKARLAKTEYVVGNDDSKCTSIAVNPPPTFDTSTVIVTDRDNPLPVAVTVTV